MSRCPECQGIGLVKKISETFCCELGCFQCENSKTLGMYEECPFCWGTGKMDRDKTNLNIVKNSRAPRDLTNE